MIEHVEHRLENFRDTAEVHQPAVSKADGPLEMEPHSVAMSMNPATLVVNRHLGESMGRLKTVFLEDFHGGNNMC